MAQQNGFYLLNVPKSAEVSSIGGEAITGWGNITGASLENAALLKDSAGSFIHIDYFAYLADSRLSSAALWTVVKGKWPLSVNFRVLDYGNFDGYNAGGDPLGEFSAADYQLAIGSSLNSRNFSIGGNLNYIHSRYSNWSAHMLAADLAGVFIHPEHELVVSLQVKNLGFVFNDYNYGSSGTKVPLDIKMGSTFKPENMPFRFTLTLYRLNPFEQSPFNDLVKEKKYFGHLIAGGEFILNQNIQLLMGMNFLRRYELQQSTGSAGSGFNFGFRFSKKDFRLTYGRAAYHTGEIGHQFSIDFNTHVFKNIYNKRK